MYTINIRDCPDVKEFFGGMSDSDKKNCQELTGKITKLIVNQTKLETTIQLREF